MNNDTQEFIEGLKRRPDILGIILFGSWARGNNRLDSDVDLVVIVTEGFRRSVEYKNTQAFEIIYTTEKAAFEFWESHKDDCAGLWEVAKVVYDKDRTIERLQTKVKEMFEAGKKPYDQWHLGQVRFDAEDLLRYVEHELSNDPATANLLLYNKVFALTEVFFDLRQQWTPAPKQRLSKIKNVSLEFYALLEQFYRDDGTIEDKLHIARRMIPVVFHAD
jgi:predicted nucleotidyltransferase